MPTYTEIQTEDGRASFTISFSDDERREQFKGRKMPTQRKPFPCYQGAMNESGAHAEELGRGIDYKSTATDEELANILRELTDEAEATLPPGSFYEIRGKIPTNYGQDLGLAWYCVQFTDGFQDPIKDEWLFDDGPKGGVAMMEDGYIQVAIRRTPK